MGLRRHFITGEWEEYEDTGAHELIVYEGKAEKTSRSSICAKRPWVSESLGVSNPDQIGQYSKAAAKFAGPGVSYDKQGRLVCDSRAARNRALKWLRKVDYDGGYGDFTGR